VGVDTLVPVQEALNIDGVANVQSTNGGVYIGIGTGQVNLYAEVVGSAVVANGYIDVIAGLAILVFMASMVRPLKETNSF